MLTRLAGDNTVGPSISIKAETNANVRGSHTARNVDDMEKPDDESPRKRVRFSDQNEVFFHRKSSSIVTP